MARTSPSAALARVAGDIIACERCTRLRAYCLQVARDRRAAYRHEEYWGKPVPGFGDPAARVLLLGLAPAAHGANRTGRVFTGDGTGGSGDFLMAALHRAGFANQTTSTHADDGLRLADAYIAAAVRCAPPDNKPLPEEVAACAGHLDAELAALRQVQIVVALGKIAWDAWFQHLARAGMAVRPRPAFAHGRLFTRPEPMNAGSAAANVTQPPDAGTWHANTHASVPGTVIGAYHPSRQNTNTGKVTPAMYDDVFRVVNARLHPPA